MGKIHSHIQRFQNFINNRTGEHESNLQFKGKGAGCLRRGGRDISLSSRDMELVSHPKLDRELAKRLSKLELLCFARPGERVSDKLSIHSAAESYIVKRSNLLADAIIGPDGNVDLRAVDILLERDDIFRGEVPGNDAHIITILKKIKSDPALRKAIFDIVSNKNKPEPSVNDIIRVDLGLGLDEEVTDAHARKAALGALFANLRQGPVASCYTTAIAIKIHDECPKLFLEKVGSCIRDGYLTTSHGEKLALEDQMPDFSLDGMISINRLFLGYSYMRGIDGKRIRGHKLHEIAGIKEGLFDIGIPESEHKEVIIKALDSLPKRNIFYAIFKNKTVTVRELLKQVALNEAGIDRTTLKLREISNANDLSVDKDINELEKFDRIYKVLVNTNFKQVNNTLLRSWEYTLAATGGEGNKVTQMDASLLKAFTENLLKGISLKKIEKLYKKEYTQDLFQNPNTTLYGQIEGSFRISFGKKLNERIRCRFVDGKVLLMDARGGADNYFAPNSPKMQKIVEEILVEMGNNGFIDQDLLGKICKMSNTDETRVEFISNMIVSHAREYSKTASFMRASMKEYLGDKYSSLKSIDEQVLSSLEGGDVKKVIAELLGLEATKIKEIALGSNETVEDFMTNLLQELQANVEHIDGIDSLCCSVDGDPIGHTFRLMLDEMKDLKCKRPKDWLSEKLGNDGDIIKLADTNWGVDGQKVLVGVKNENGKLVFVPIYEDGTILKCSELAYRMSEGTKNESLITLIPPFIINLLAPGVINKAMLKGFNIYFQSANIGKSS